MRKINWIIIGCLLLLLGACSSDDNFDLPAGHAQYVEFDTRIQPAKSSRVSVDITGKGHFTAGDEIKLFAGGDTYCMTLGADGWTPRLSWDQFQEPTTTFKAYYPYGRQQIGGTFVHKVEADQSTEEAYTRSDLLFASQTVSHGGKVDMNFKHTMSHLTVTLLSNGAFTDEELAAATVTVYSANELEVDGSTGQPKRIRYNSLPDIKMRHRGGTTFAAVLCPQTISGISDYQDLKWLTIHVGDQTFSYLAPHILKDGTVFNELEPGKSIAVTLRLNREIEEIWSGQTHWVYGLNNPPLDDHTKWGYAFVEPVKKEYRLIGLSWEREYGWFDCNKKDPSGPAYGDQSLCWAATASNMIHWWLEQNQEYLARYGEYTGPREYPNSLDSEVFQYFKDHFEDRGGHVQNGLNWFFTGRKADNLKPGMEHSGNWFGKVFGTGTSVVGVSQFTSGEPGIEKRVADALKSAFRKRRAIGCSFLLPGELSGHAVTIWGAEFNQHGVVTALYLCDNNNIDWELNVPDITGLDRPCVASGIIRRPVDYHDNYAWIEGGQMNAFTLKLDQLVFLDLHEDKWIGYLKGQGK